MVITGASQAPNPGSNPGFRMPFMIEFLGFLETFIYGISVWLNERVGIRAPLDHASELWKNYSGVSCFFHPEIHSHSVYKKYFVIMK